MNELINIMARDMKISPYADEPEESYGYRVIYSALGLWCLTSSLCEKDNKKEISKNAHSILMHRLLEKYLQLCPHAKRLLVGSRNSDIAVHIRNLYEQTGYLLTLDDNRNVLNQGGETVRVYEGDSIFLGIPEGSYCINGLGVHTENGEREISLKDYLVRDSLSSEEYLLSCFDSCDFYEKDIEPSELEFFNPFYRGKLSEAWKKYRNADMTIARKSPVGPYYRVMENDMGKLVFAEENSSEAIDLITGAEFRRLYIALKEYYLNPMLVIICPIDKEYSYIRILGQLPNREYYYMLLNAWPKNAFNDRNNFIIRNELTAQAVQLLVDIGFAAKDGEFYG